MVLLLARCNEGGRACGEHATVRTTISWRLWRDKSVTAGTCIASPGMGDQTKTRTEARGLHRPPARQILPVATDAKASQRPRRSSPHGGLVKVDGEW